MQLRKIGFGRVPVELKPLEDFERLFGQVVRKRRLAKALSQEAFGDLCNLHRTYISDIERGRKAVSLRSLFAIARALEVRAHVLIQETEEWDV